jgi:hypothetical protein
MTSKDLRIGNWVKWGDGIIQFELGMFNREDIIYAEPIPLTEEWLLRMGFEKLNQHYWSLNGFNYQMIFSNNSLDVHKRKYLIKNVKHVHSLQNLYFALTGQELEIKEI